jgi:hypothetical protein
MLWQAVELLRAMCGDADAAALIADIDNDCDILRDG